MNTTTTPTTIFSDERKNLSGYQKKLTSKTIYKLKTWPKHEKKHQPYSRTRVVNTKSSTRLIVKNFDNITPNSNSRRRTNQEVKFSFECKKRLSFESPAKNNMDGNEAIDELQQLLEQTAIKSDPLSKKH